MKVISLQFVRKSAQGGYFSGDRRGYPQDDFCFKIQALVDSFCHAFASLVLAELSENFRSFGQGLVSGDASTGILYFNRAALWAFFNFF